MGSAGDLYIVMPGFELKDQSVSLQIVVNPLVSWIWFGFGLLGARRGDCAAARARLELRPGARAGSCRAVVDWSVTRDGAEQDDANGAGT